MTRSQLSRHLGYRWYFYLLILLAAVVLWTSVYGILAKPNANEQLTVSYFGEDYNGTSLEQDIIKVLPEITEQKIKKVLYDGVAYKDNSYFGQMLQTRLFSSDIMIFESGIVDGEFINMSFRPLTAELEAELSAAGAEIYRVDGVAYGVSLEKSSNFSKYYEGELSCFALFAPYSENMAGAYGIGNESDGAAIELMKYFAEVPNG